MSFIGIIISFLSLTTINYSDKIVIILRTRYKFWEQKKPWNSRNFKAFGGGPSGAPRRFAKARVGFLSPAYSTGRLRTSAARTKVNHFGIVPSRLPDQSARHARYPAVHWTAGHTLAPSGSSPLMIDLRVKKRHPHKWMSFFKWWTIRGSNEMFGVKNWEKWRVPALFAVGPTQKSTQSI